MNRPPNRAGAGPSPRLWNPDSSPAELANYLSQLPLPRAVLIPCSDDWTKAVAELPETLRERFPASISPASVIHTMIDKWRFAEMLQQLTYRGQRRCGTSVEAWRRCPSSYENMF
jgi:hypothetical protein